MKRKILYRLFTVGASIAIFIIIGFIAIMVPANSKAFYRWQFDKHNTLEWVQSQGDRLYDENSPDYDPYTAEYVCCMNEQQLEELMLHVVRYCMWLEDDMNVTVDGHYLKIFREDERAHMRDVRNVFGVGTILTIISVLICIAFLFFLLNRPKAYYETSRKVPFITLGILFAIFVAIALYVVIDFKYVFEVVFHNMFFDGNFAFSSGVMISMIGEIFPDLVMLIGISWIVMMALPVLVFVFYNKRLAKKIALQVKNEDKNNQSTEEKQ